MIYSSIKDNLKKLLIEGKLNEQEKKVLIEELTDRSQLIHFEITFLDIKILPDDIFKALDNIKSKAKIGVNTKTLWHYLSKLGIGVQYKDSYNSLNNIKAPIQAIVIGGSAGSIEKLLPIIKSIPYLDISIFVVTHVLPYKKNHLHEIIQTVTDYKVFEASNHLEIEKGCLYVAKPDFHMIVSDGCIFLDDSKAVKFARPSIDMTFKSVAYEYKSSLLAILLCGYGSDGSDSMKDLKKNGCDILIEEPEDCDAKEMLTNAIKSAMDVRILSVEKIQSYLRSTLNVSVDIKDEMENFLKNIYVLYGHDFTNYDRLSLSRRVELIMKKNGITNFKEFEKLVFDDDKFFNKLLSAFSINVTSFFRNPVVFKDIKDVVLPYLESFASIRIWCAGCSRGDEPYSIAMLLDEMGLLHKSQIYATDFNYAILEEAKNGLYPINEYNEAKVNYLQTGGQRNFEDWFEINDRYVQVKKNIKDKVIFFQHNLALDGSINEFHLVVCRNVLIYFDKCLQKRVFKLIDESLFRNSFVVLGKSEIFLADYNYKEIGEKRNKIYKKLHSN